MQDRLQQRSMVERIAPHFLPARRTQDADEHGKCLTAWHGVYEHVGRQSFRGEMSELWLWPIQIFRERLDQPCIFRGGAWPRALVLLAVTEARGNFSVDGRALPASALTVLPGDDSIEGFNSAPVDSVGVAVDEAALVAFAKRHGYQVEACASVRHSLAIDDPDAMVTFRDGVTSILDALEACPSLLDEQWFREQVKDRVLRLLSSLLDAHIPKAQRLSPPTTRSYVVEKAVQFMEERLADPLEMVDLCQALRVCPRTLRYSFEEVLGVSPTQYLMSLRLGRVRRALLQQSTKSNVQCVAARFGFSHMGRFARFYHEAFGERPSDTLRRRDHGAAEPRSSPRRLRRRAGTSCPVNTGPAMHV